MTKTAAVTPVIYQRLWARRLLQDLEAADAKGAFVDKITKAAAPDEDSPARRAVLVTRSRAAVKAKDWTRAAEAYAELARIAREDWPLYLRAYALEQAGQKAEGEALRKRIELLMIGSSDERYALAEEAEELGLWAIAESQYDWVVRTAEPLEVYWMNAAQSLALSEKIEPVRAARLMESFLIAHVGSSAFFTSDRPDIELHLTKRQHELAARAAAERKDWDRVMTEMKAALELYPGDIDGALVIVPLLDAAGRRPQADQLIALQVKYFDDLLARYPRAATDHNQIAWLCARTRRNLDAALQHADKAVEFKPRSASFLDTLAEVHFARGDVREAIAIEKRALEIEPATDSLREQLKRFEAALPGKAP